MKRSEIMEKKLNRAEVLIEEARELVLGAVCLTIAVMLVRMWQIWSGEIVNLS